MNKNSNQDVRWFRDFHIPMKRQTYRFWLIYRIVKFVHPIKINLSFILKLVLMHLLDVLWMQSNLYQGIVNNLEVLGIPPKYVTIIIRDIPLENWGIRGGQAACDVAFGI